MVIKTETGDFDYRSPGIPVSSAVAPKDEDHRLAQPLDPFGLGMHEDADLRQMEVPVS